MVCFEITYFFKIEYIKNEIIIKKDTECIWIALYWLGHHQAYSNGWKEYCYENKHLCLKMKQCLIKLRNYVTYANPG